MSVLVSSDLLLPSFVRFYLTGFFSPVPHQPLGLLVPVSVTFDILTHYKRLETSFKTETFNTPIQLTESTCIEVFADPFSSLCPFVFAFLVNLFLVNAYVH